ncbi:hypothetical protein P879_00393 [Paragonimus westermani]|uniref:Mediator of RNA polymerase II transcription subunit 20 n=1 Tax=Paragonimus westermani TaxID=34504 RepID=A0A8T0DWC8_9TREM|nr:hypothetical protein P879_00393 [Paragonimus westermani]
MKPGELMSGVSCVLLWNSVDGKVGPQSLENLVKKIELLGAVRIGRMHIESAIYFASQSRSTCKNFQVLTSSEYPASCFVFTDSNTMLVGDLAFREFAGYLKSAFQRKRKLQVEGKGIKYKLGDFGLNFVTLFMGQSANVKGYLIEVTFGASCMIHLCGDILRAFITQVLPGVCPPVGDPSMAENIFSHSFHKAVQTGCVDSPRWPPVHVAVGGLQATPFDQPLSHACARLTMTQYAEHMNTVRRLSRQVSQPVSSSSNSISTS